MRCFLQICFSRETVCKMFGRKIASNPHLQFKVNICPSIWHSTWQPKPKSIVKFLKIIWQAFDPDVAWCAANNTPYKSTKDKCSIAAISKGYLVNSFNCFHSNGAKVDKSQVVIGSKHFFKTEVKKLREKDSIYLFYFSNTIQKKRVLINAK